MTGQVRGDLDQRIGDLRTQLLRYRADRHPAEHATTQFQLGTTLLQADRPEQARAALRTAADMFEDNGYPVEHAKAANMLGAALRDLGELSTAATIFEAAAATFEVHQQVLEHGAALHNLGLVRRDLGDMRDAADCFRRAREDFADGGPPAQASAAAREHGAVLLELGQFDLAVRTLEEALELSSKAGDREAMGAAANVLGLVHLGAEQTSQAVEALRMAVATNPRSVRPQAHAMAKANLALAYDRMGNPVRARLAARQARGVPAAPEAVVAQAGDILDRLGDPLGDLALVLDDTEQDDWARAIRDEAVRWVDADRPERLARTGAWIDGQLAADDEVGRAAAYLDVLLELPPEAMESLLTATLTSLQERGPEDRRAFRKQISRGLGRFNVPQWMRLKDTLNRIADEVGDDGSWG